MKSIIAVWLFFCILFLNLNTVLAQKIKVGKWRNITTELQDKKKIDKFKSNNNVDAIAYKGRYYMSCRSAPTHFASEKTKMYILSTTDMQDWKVESEIALGRDKREPRFAIQGDSLYMYFFTGSKNWYEFKPDALLVTVTDGGGKWSEPSTTGLDGYVPWRIRMKDGMMYMSAYYGVDLYNKNHKGDLRLFTSKDARTWQPLTEQPQIGEPSAEEGEFIFDKSGRLYGTIRLESTGSLIVSADSNDLGNWKYKRSKFKYDSALLFEHDDEIYLIARRNVPGEVDRSKKWLGDNTRRILNLTKYSLSSKKTALYKFDKENLDIVHIMDFESNGDNAFPAIIQLSENQYGVFNYSSDIDTDNKIWLEGQVGKTYLYYSTLTFEEN